MKIRTLALLVASVSLLGAALTAGAQTPKKYALLIGLDHYRHIADGIVELRFAEDDVTDLAQALGEHGYETTALLNLQAKRKDIIGEIYRHAELVRKHDTFLLFFAGHGVRNRAVNQRGYWLTYEANLGSLDIEGIRLTHLLDYLSDIPGRKLVLLDHCYSGDVVRDLSGEAEAPVAALDATAPAGAPPAAAGGAGARAPGAGRKLQRGVYSADELKQEMGTAQGVLVVAAAREAALESPDLGHGVFTHTLLAALQTATADDNSDGQLDASELIRHVRQQVPVIASQIGGTQAVREIAIGEGLMDWVVAGPLPEAPQSLDVDRFLQTLNRWKQNGWIVLRTKLVCRRVLEKVESGEPLNPLENEILREMREHIDLEEIAEDLRARDLEDVIAALRE